MSTALFHSRFSSFTQYPYPAKATELEMTQRAKILETAVDWMRPGEIGRKACGIRPERTTRICEDLERLGQLESRSFEGRRQFRRKT